MSSELGQILIIILLMIANGIFAMSEIAVVSARKTHLQQLANTGNRKAQIALELANSPNQFLSTVQIGITLIGILAGAFGGATIAEKLAAVLQKIPVLAPYSNFLGFGIVVLGIAYLSLIIGELVPKRLALNKPEELAMYVARPMSWLAKLTAPLVHLLSISTDLMLKILRIRITPETPVTEEEIKVLIDEGAKAGLFEETEKAMMERVFELDDRKIYSLMTPRSKTIWLDIEDPPEDNLEKIVSTNHHYYPVIQDSFANILGVIQVKDLFSHNLTGQAFDIRDYLREPLFVPENISVLKVLELFKKSGMHTALVIDEYGDYQGMVTLTDILEAIVGEMTDLDAPNEPLAVQREDGSWLLDGMLPIDELKELFAINELPDEDRNYYQTLSGFIMLNLGRIPVATDHFEWGGLRFEVIDMDGNRIDKVLVTPAET